VWNRDVNAAKNILTLLNCLVDGKERPSGACSARWPAERRSAAAAKNILTAVSHLNHQQGGRGATGTSQVEVWKGGGLAVSAAGQGTEAGQLLRLLRHAG
jgi:hypothetical protein